MDDIVPKGWVQHKFGSYPILCPERSRLDVLCQELKQEFPKLKMGRKRDRWIHRAIHWIIVIFTFGTNKTYLERYTTTLKNRVDWSDKKHEILYKATPNVHDLDRVWSTLMHERIHLRQFAKYGTFIMFIMYVFVILPLFAAIGRTFIEKPGYIQTLRCWYVLDPRWARSPDAKKWWTGQFLKSNYGWMALVIWWLPGKWYDKELGRLEQGIVT